ncbi:MAG: type II secretion system protein [Dehalococcoidia bacterium]|nr:type II secretion system protein [Dehalococcoidia bacterium]MSQ16150.1 type II secretion system protein [Dehalococcoidia bacterium]
MLKKFINRVARGQKGFTLIEMIVVVGIIAVLAAVIIPNIGRFIGSGEEGAKAAESESVQTAMNAMMADKATQTVTPVDSGDTSVQVWTSQPVEDTTDPGAVGLEAYLQDKTTVYSYCFDAQGQITEQLEVATAGSPPTCT